MTKVRKVILFFGIALLIFIFEKIIPFNPYYFYKFHFDVTPESANKFINSDPAWMDINAYIAHGGGIGQFTYKNSREAFLDSIHRGFRYIELDLLLTSDGKILAGHDWVTFKQLTSYPEKTDTPLSSEVVRTLKIDGNQTPLFGEEIANLMKKYPNTILVTDKTKDYSELLNQIPYPDRMIVEVFNMRDYLSALEAGVLYPALSAGGYRNAVRALLYDIPIITVDIKHFFDDNVEQKELIKILHDSGVMTMGFFKDFKDRNSPDFFKTYMGSYFDKVYTDSFFPSNRFARGH